MKVVLLPGDGIGNEISQSVKKVNEALNTNIEFLEYEAGAEYAEKNDVLMQEGLIEAIQENKLALKGPTATPIGKGFRSINVKLRQECKTYQNIRPMKSIEGIESRYDDVDIVIFRENSEDLYLGVEYMCNNDIAHAIKIITRNATNKIVTAAFEYAKKNHRKKVTCVHKANIMKLTDGLFLEEFEEVAKEYPDIESDACIVDALCMKLVQDPNQFDVLVTSNLYGDIISDLCAGLIGGLGFAPSVNAGDDVRIYEAVHGSAPDIAGKDLANPTAILLAFEMLLRDNGKEKEADKLKKAILETIKEGKIKTQDMGGTAKCSEYTDAIIERIKA